MEKYNIIKSTYSNGITNVVISTPYGNFSGKARLNPEDKENYESKFFGESLALRRACIKYYRMIVRIEKEKIKDKECFLSTLSQSKNYDETSFYVKRLKKDLFIAKQRRDSIIEELNYYISCDKIAAESHINNVNYVKNTLLKREKRAENMNKLREQIHDNIIKTAAKKKKSRVAEKLKKDMVKDN